ncbi:MAG TPA: DJ-1/PfpI family protein [Luteimonas sp.]|nr:DJ-1/PfpI family protein [Luteimonas sp.]
MATITVVMIDGVADWEIGVVLPAAREWFSDQIQIASIDGAPLTSIGGLRIHPQVALADLDPLAGDLWLLPGSDRWRDGEIPALSRALRARVEAGLPLAAICGATVALGHAGLLDARPHTSNSLAFLRDNTPGYAGASHYRDAKVVAEGGLVTAPGTSPVGFACECLRVLHPEQGESIAQVRAMFAGEFEAG